MRIVTTALGSFVLGAVCMSLFGNHTSILRQPESVFAQSPNHLPVPPSMLRGNQSTPVVPIPPRNIQNGDITEYGAVPVDGANISNSLFRDVTLVYGGGAYRITNSAFTGKTDFQFIGAAANTVQFLASFGMLGCPAKPQLKPWDPNAPIIQSTELTDKTRRDFVAPFMGGQ
jgi:hypothetical protein